MTGWWRRLRWRLAHPACMWPGCHRRTADRLWYCDMHAPVPGTLWAPKGQ